MSQNVKEGNSSRSWQRAVDEMVNDLEVTLPCRCEEMCKTLKYYHNNLG